MALTRNPDHVRPTRRGPDPNRPTGVTSGVDFLYGLIIIIIVIILVQWNNGGFRGVIAEHQTEQPFVAIRSK